MSVRVAYMTGEYPRATDTFIQREVAALRRMGAEIETLSIRKPAEKEQVGPEQQAERERTHYILPASAWTLVKAHGSALLNSPRRYFGSLRTALTIRPPGLKASIRQLAYFAEAAVVAQRMRALHLPHLHNHFSNSSCSVAMLAAQMGGFTFSFTMHGPAEFYEPKYWRIEEKIRRAAFVACISSFCRSQAMVFARQEDWGKLKVVHCGVTPSLYPPRRHEGRGTRLLFVGRLAAVKGVPVLLEAMAELVEAHPGLILQLAGDGPDRGVLEARARELAVERNVTFLGYQSQAQVRELLARADVFVLPSFAEGVPVVLMEAMAAGVPVVATRIAGVPELVEDGVTGWLVPPGEREPLRDRIARLLDEADLRNRFAVEGRAIVERSFDVDSEASKLHAAFEERASAAPS